MTHSFPTRRSSDLKYMSRLYKINRKYLTFRKYDDNFILNIFLKKSIKEGNYFKAKNILINTLNFIQDKEKKKFQFTSYCSSLQCISHSTNCKRRRMNFSHQCPSSTPTSL